MEIKLLHWLDRHQPASISEIAHALKTTVLEILKTIAKIKQIQAGLIINRDTAYNLSHQLDWFDAARIKQLMLQNNLDYNLQLIDQLESTNAYALKHIEQFKSKTIISCDWQYSGRGRFGRRWLSKIAEDLTLSIVYVFPSNYNIALLPIICAVAINRLLKNYAIQNAIKWPNDIYVNQNKVAGILVENLVRNQQFHTIIGIGLDNFASWERNKLLVELVTSIDNLIGEFNLFGFALLRREWLDNCCHLGKQVTIMQNGNSIAEGKHLDIDEQGALVIQDSTGLKVYSSAAISLLINDK
jgi:BirA family biotin operon repressor/biotin-[acetyl-CoA-carboxylase] ligase